MGFLDKRIVGGMGRIVIVAAAVRRLRIVA